MTNIKNINNNKDQIASQGSMMSKGGTGTSILSAWQTPQNNNNNSKINDQIASQDSMMLKGGTGTSPAMLSAWQTCINDTVD